MALDPKEFERVFANHFEKINPEEFLTNLKKACPDLAVPDSSQKDTNNSHNTLEISAKNAKNTPENNRTRRDIKIGRRGYQRSGILIRVSKHPHKASFYDRTRSRR